MTGRLGGSPKVRRQPKGIVVRGCDVAQENLLGSLLLVGRVLEVPFSLVDVMT